MPYFLSHCRRSVCLVVFVYYVLHCVIGLLHYNATSMSVICVNTNCIQTAHHFLHPFCIPFVLHLVGIRLSELLSKSGLRRDKSILFITHKQTKHSARLTLSNMVQIKFTEVWGNLYVQLSVSMPYFL